MYELNWFREQIESYVRSFLEEMAFFKHRKANYSFL